MRIPIVSLLGFITSGKADVRSKIKVTGPDITMPSFQINHTFAKSAISEIDNESLDATTLNLYLFTVEEIDATVTELKNDEQLCTIEYVGSIVLRDVVLFKFVPGTQ
uniref:Uncharacterized protein n=1 Tax=Romanomermis culicivorax TaxID=13658 RepID=A0A915IG87_ROMCU